MSDKLYKVSLPKLLKWILAEEKEGKIFGIYKELFFTPSKTDLFKIQRYEQLLETPIGVAAGPHTQLAQNIVAAWLTGSRYIELKTVQTLDEIKVAKPCIEMEDEGYNCEWSQELKVKDSFDEYLNAWILIHILKDKFGWNSPEFGTIFNMSIGYDLKGIMNPNIQWFLDKMDDCSEELDKKIDSLTGIYPDIKNLKIPARISNCVTLSTMHGCPPNEIESIAKYLIEKRKLHTTVKLNPTLLGAEDLRYILNEKLGYETIVPDEAFEHDLKYGDGLKIIKTLIQTAKKNSVQFGLKLTNTLESLNRTKELPKDQQMVYMSGRALHPISINLAAKLQNEFNGELDISFSAGADAFNVSDVLACNIKPVTVCSDLLKPGGYTRISQYLMEIKKNIENVSASGLDEFVLKHSPDSKNVKLAGLNYLNKYAGKVINNKRYKKSFFIYDNIKTDRNLPAFDCIYAPCINTCAISQDVPNYMYYTAQGEFRKAFEVIIKTNPLPHITGMVCDHLCQSKCTRINYDNPLLIREIKRFVTEREEAEFKLRPKPLNGLKTAVIGAGPSGLSAAYFLALEGFEVEVFESNNFAGGMVSGVIPVFRISEEAIRSDIENIASLGVKFNYNVEITKDYFNQLRKDFNFIYVAVGARKGKKLNIKGEDLDGVYDQLTFLSMVRSGVNFNLGKRVAIIGGGNSAIDAARTVRRIVGADATVTLIYRRTKKEMPADKDEIAALEEEKISVLELTAPENISKGINNKKKITFSKMKLGKLDSSGRPRPIKIDGSGYELEFDSIITAVGQDIILDFLPDEKLVVDNKTNETQIENIFAGGDAVRGADSLINAIKDGKQAAENIIKKANNNFTRSVEDDVKKMSLIDFQKKQAFRQYGKSIPVIPVEKRNGFELVHHTLDEISAIEEANRCLYCDEVCNVCVSVCPNLANIAVEFDLEEIKFPIVEIKNDDYKIIAQKSFRISQEHQIINLGDFCNECGNCATFCPTNGAPYKIKPKFYLTRESFQKEDDCYFLKDNYILYKNNGNVISLKFEDEKVVFKSNELKAELTVKDFKLTNIKTGSQDLNMFNFSKAAELFVLFKNLRNNGVFPDAKGVE